MDKLSEKILKYRDLSFVTPVPRDELTVWYAQVLAMEQKVEALQEERIQARARIMELLDTEGTNDECHITMSLSNGHVRIAHCNRSFGMRLDHWPPGSSETAYLLRRLGDMFSPLAPDVQARAIEIGARLTLYLLDFASELSEDFIDYVLDALIHCEFPLDGWLPEDLATVYAEIDSLSVQFEDFPDGAIREWLQTARDFFEQQAEAAEGD